MTLPWPVRTDHLLALVDDTGIMQHADGIVPQRSSGYCVDDVARLVVVAWELDRVGGDRTFSGIAVRGLSFLRHAWDSVSTGMHNFLSFERCWLDRPSVGDHVGRTVWALGATIAADPAPGVAAPAGRLLDEVCAAVDRCGHLRTVAYMVIGLTRPSVGLLPSAASELVGPLAQRLLRAYRCGVTTQWRWFEDDLRYDNARLSQALIAAGRVTGRTELTAAGLESLDWYGRQCGIADGPLRLVGNAWRCTRLTPGQDRDDDDDDGDEQPLDCAAIVEAYTEALRATGDRHYGVLASRAFAWFTGGNRFGVPVYDVETGGCHDGLGVGGVNGNQGAESTLAFFQAVLALRAADLSWSLTGPPGAPVPAGR